jgi:vacuolar-type H+-ATPase subunit B/Vma2/intein/homing endonuclease
MKFEMEYSTIESVAGPLVVVGKVGTAGYNEIVRIRMANGEYRLGQVLDTSEKYAVVQVFGRTDGINVNKTSVSFLGETFRLGVGDDMLGRIFNGQGKPLDVKTTISYEDKRDINGEPINPVSRQMPSDFIETGISAIDGLDTLVRGQKLPLFSGSGLPHNEIAAQITRQASVKNQNEAFAVVFAGIGLMNDDAAYFINEFRKTGALARTVAFINLANDPSIERILTPRLALTTAEFLAYEKGMHVLTILTDMTNYCFHGDTEVILGDGTINKIGKYVEETLNEKTSIINILTSSDMLMSMKNTVRILNLPKAKTLTWNGHTGTIARISATQKIVAPKYFVSIKTRSGAELKVTPDHKILVDTLDGSELIPAEKLNKGMEVYSLKEFNIKPTQISLLRLLCEEDKNFYVHMKDNTIEKLLSKKYGSIKNACNILSLDYSRISESLSKRCYKTKELKISAEDIGITLEEVTSKINYITFGGKERISLSTSVLTPDYYKILGWIASDGVIYEDKENGNYYVAFTNKNKELINEFLKEMEKLFPGINPQVHKNQDGVLIARVNSGVLSYIFSKLLLRGEDNELNPVFKADQECISAFLSAYLDGDGSIPNKKLITYITARKIRAKRLQQLLKRLGIQSSIQERRSQGTFGSSHAFDVVIRGKEDLIKASNLLKPSHKIKALSMRELKTNIEKKDIHRGTYYRLAPYICGDLFKTLRTRYKIRAKNIGSSSTISQFETHKRRISIPTLNKMLKKLENVVPHNDQDYKSLCDFIDGNYILDRITSIEKIGNKDQEYVYDFTVEDTHRIVAENGLITSNCEALRELSSAREEVPGRRGYPGYMYTDLASLYERAGVIKGKKGTITQLDILTMPSDDVTHPIPDLTGYITEGQICVSRELKNRGIYPPITPIGSLSRLMNNGIGNGKTREDHRGVADQLYGAYARAQEAKSLSSIVGAEALSESDRRYLKFGDDFEKRFIGQGFYEKRTIEDTLAIGWDLLSELPEAELTRIKEDYVKKYYKKK